MHTRASLAALVAALSTAGLVTGCGQEAHISVNDWDVGEGQIGRLRDVPSCGDERGSVPGAGPFAVGSVIALGFGVPEECVDSTWLGECRE